MNVEQPNNRPRYVISEAPKGPGSSPWAKVTAIGAAVSALTLVACAALTWRVHEADALRAKTDAAALQAAVRDISAAVRAATAVTWVRARDTANDCWATNDRFHCVVTNATDQPIEACFLGTLAQKKGGGTMRSFPLCTGRVGLRETREVSVPWERGDAEDICNKFVFGSTKVLDFDACDFGSEPIDPEARQ